jgi:hypothetical protein
MATPTATKPLEVQRTITDLETFAEVTVTKRRTYTPVASAHEALARLGNDNAKFTRILNEGLMAEERRQLAQDASVTWTQTDEEGNETPFTGVQADNVKVNAFVLGMAKHVYGYNKDLTAEQKAEAKASAVAMIKATPVMFDGMKKNCAVSD